jgi:hypothetical protein
VTAHDRHAAPGSCLSYLANEHSDARIGVHAEVVSLDSYDHVSATSAAISDSFASSSPYSSFMRGVGLPATISIFGRSRRDIDAS